MLIATLLLAVVQAGSDPVSHQRRSVPLLEDFFNAAGVTRAEAMSVPWISRFDLDVDGDGRKEYFLALPGTNTGQDWVVYTCPPDACRSLGVVRFHASLFFYSLADRRLWSYVRVSGQEGGWTQYFLGPAGFEEDMGSKPHGHGDWERDLAYAKKWIRSSKPPQGWASMSGVLQDNERWQDLDTKKDVLAPIHLSRLEVKQW